MVTTGSVSEDVPLVPGRTCGSCVVCCYAMKIDTPELEKPAGKLCAHCAAKGCGIYETRFPVCRSFYCAWRWTPELSDEWRPDRSGVLVVRLNEGMPERFPIRKGYYFIMLGGEAAIGRLGFVDVVLALVARSVPAFMAATSPMGDVYGHAIMNNVLAASAIKRDRTAAFGILVSLHQQLMAGQSANMSLGPGIAAASREIEKS